MVFLLFSWQSEMSCFWKGCDLLGINLFVALLYILAPQVMGDDVYSEDRMIISTVRCFMCYLKKIESQHVSFSYSFGNSKIIVRVLT